MLGPMNVALPRSLNVDQFLAWAVRQEEAKYELVDGEVVREPPQTWGHTRTKMQTLIALRTAVDASTAHYVAPNGPTVRVSARTAFVPDALVAPLPEPAPDGLEVPNPTIVVEVLSPSTARMDAITKLRGYFEVPSVQHYLIVDPEGQTVTHHKRGAGTMETRVIAEGTLALDPPGLEIRLGDVFKPATA